MTTNQKIIIASWVILLATLAITVINPKLYYVFTATGWSFLYKYYEVSSQEFFNWFQEKHKWVFNGCVTAVFLMVVSIYTPWSIVSMFSWLGFSGWQGLLFVVSPAILVFIFFDYQLYKHYDDFHSNK